MNTLMKVGKYTHIIYYVIAFFVYFDLMLIMFAPESQMGIVGTGCLLGLIFGSISTFLRIKEKSIIKTEVNIGIALGVILIILFGPGV